MSLEKRHGGVEFTTPKGEVSGYVCRWDTPHFIDELGKKESFKKGCFSWPRNVALYAQHAPHRVLASSKAGTLRLEETQEGLKFKALLPKSALDTREALERGDLCGASAGFYTDEDSHEMGQRVVEKARLSEISLVHDASHPHTELSL